ncbi:MAG: hypothetical protein V4676_09345 [Bacteroidota bacterium]
MKKQFLGLLTVVALGFTACNNDKDTTSEITDSTGSTTTVVNSTNDYTALADSFQRVSDAGMFMDARTGAPIKISVDRTTGRRTNAATSEPITRYIYVDNSDWWVYDADGVQQGRAKMDGDKVMYQGDGDKWVDYDTKWKVDEDGDTKMKSDDMKIKTDKDGDIKIKTDSTKTKIDKDGKVKTKES